MTNPETPSGWLDQVMAVAYLDGLSDPVVVLDQETRVREANAAFLEFTSVERAALLGQPLGAALLDGSPASGIVEALERMARAGQPERLVLNLAGDGRPDTTVVLTGIPLSGGVAPRLLAVRVEDVTQMMRERAENDAQRIAANETARALERLNKELEGFSCSVAHDLRAPLRFIDKFAFLLMERHSHELSSEGLQYAEQIREGSRQMAQLVEDLLQFSRVTGRELKRETIDMTRLAEQAIAEVQLDIEDEQRDVVFDVGELGTVKGDSGLIRQVLTNLIGNAAKFTRRAKRAVIAISRTGEPAVFTVSDNGVGFDAREAERLFTVFQRYHQPEDFEGSGVGLAVVKRVVNRHGGAVWAESSVGKGARFHFTLAPGTTAQGEVARDGG